MFHPIGGLSQQEQQQQNTRVVTADGTPYLKVPGLRRVTSVRLDSLEIPLTREIEFPVDAGGTKTAMQTLPLIALMAGEDGTPVLLRSQLSNDGYWQKDARVYVTGEWDEEAQGRRGRGN